MAALKWVCSLRSSFVNIHYPAIRSSNVVADMKFYLRCVFTGTDAFV
jgi:hypothetical protein